MLGSIGKAKEFRRESMNDIEKKDDKKLKFKNDNKMDLNSTQLLDKRRHVKVFDTEDIFEEGLIKDLLKKTWKVTIYLKIILCYIIVIY